MTRLLSAAHFCAGADAGGGGRSAVAAFLLAVLLLLAANAPVAAQASDILAGRVVGEEGRPLVGATVTATSVETGVVRSVLTDASGRYMILFPDGGGRYEVRVSFLGMADRVVAVVREADEEVLLTNIGMSPRAIELAGITVQSRRPLPGPGNSGELVQELPPQLLNRLPLPDFDPSTLALLAAGVVATVTDSADGKAGFSVAGMNDALNQITLDGVSVRSTLTGGTGLEIPQEGLRRTQVVTSTFDVSRGGFAGGEVAMTTARGNNRASGSFTYQLRDPALSGNAARSALGNLTTQHRLSGGFGGPIVDNRLFYNVSFSALRRSTDNFAMQAGDALAFQRTGASADSVTRFLDILGSDFGFPTDGLTGAYTNVNGSLSGQLRMDWNVTPRHTLMVRGNVNAAGQDSSRISPFDLRHNGGEQDSDRWDAALQLTSRLGGTWTNELQLSTNRSSAETLPFLDLPEGRVRVTSDLDDGSRSVANLVFGGDRSMPTESWERSLRVKNELGVLLNLTHRIRAGVELGRDRFASINSTDFFGTFTFNSLEDFEANRPASFTRSLTERERRGSSVTASAWVSDTWRVSNPLQLTFGVRVDRGSFGETPEYNPAVEDAFGRRTDELPGDFRFSPRVGFSWRLSETGTPAKVLRGGIGMFQGTAPYNLFASALQQTGLESGERVVRCIGDAVPLPDWNAYLADPATIPTTCLDGGIGAAVTDASRQATVTVFDPAFGAPLSWRANIGYQQQLVGRLQANVDYTYSHGVNLYGARDINLDEATTFTLGAEGRPFFGTPGSIAPATGATSLAASRIDAAFGNVFEYASSLGSRTHQATFRLSGMLPPRLIVQGSYTLGWSRDQTSFSGGGAGGGGGSRGGFSAATTAGNPNVAEWATGSNDRRHALSLVLGYPVTSWAQLTLISRLTSGSPFTPMVGGDVNGDGASNDRAFVFDPGSTADAALADGMRRLLDRAPADIAECLRSQMGAIAERNSCRNPWTQSLDMRATFSPSLPRLGRRVEISADLSNVLAAFDDLLHSSDDLRGWGQPNRVDGTLLYPRGFDPATSSFRYVVNEQFGEARTQRFGQGAPFQIVLQARISVGQQRDAFGGLLAGARGGFGGGPGGPGDGGGMRGAGPGGFAGGRGTGGAAGPGGRAGPAADVIIDRALSNPIPIIVELGDSLGFTPEQLTAIRVVSDSLQVKLDARKVEIRKKLESGTTPAAGDTQAVMRGFQAIQPDIQAGRREMTEALRQVETILGRALWERIPAVIRNVGGRGGRRGG